VNPLKRKDVKGFERTIASANVASNKRIVALARRFSAECGLNPLDALHVSSACIGRADWFLTCKYILTKYTQIKGVISGLKFQHKFV
jgi:hypothetical protein